MELEFGLLADSASSDNSGKLYIMGEFRYLTVEGFPALHPQMALVLRLVAPTVEIPRGRPAKLRLEFVDADGQPIFPENPPPVDIAFGPVGPAERGLSHAQVILNMGFMPIQQEGDHVIHIWVEDRRIGEVKFHVLKKQPGPAIQPPQAPS